MPISFVDLKRQYQSIKPEIDATIQDVLANTAFIGGKALESFAQNFAALSGAAYCIPVGNGTDALYIALRCLGLGPGDRAVVPANSFIATSEAVTMTGANPAFCDVDPDTYNMDVALLAQLLEQDRKAGATIKAVVPVHLYGQPADMDPILELAGHYGLKVVSDAAQAHCATIQGRPVGNLGHVTCFSFYPGKNLGAYGDGGAIVTNDPDLAKLMKMTANHGRVDKYDHEFEGVNSRLDGLQAAILGVKLGHILDWTAARQANAGLYAQAMAGRPGLARFVVPPTVAADRQHVYHLYVVRAKDRDGLASHLKAKGIGVGIHYPIALPNLKAYRYLGHAPSDFPMSSAYQTQILSLPMFPELTPEEIATVVDAMAEFYNV